MCVCVSTHTVHVTFSSALLKEYVKYVELVRAFRTTPSDYCTALVALMGFVA